MASNTDHNKHEKENKNVDEVLDEKLRSMKVIFGSENEDLLKSLLQVEIKKIGEENKKYEKQNKDLEAGICEIKKATDVVKETFLK